MIDAEGLRQLVAEWRERQGIEAAFGRTTPHHDEASRHQIAELLFKECADRAEALLGAALPPAPAPDVKE
ncbi:MAG TPA: hypothetical protein VNH84_02295 [Candidatus Saccharimonadales bacterium]|nr:hypothetical protein [Candidatus Saccharimonadales bacterium]